MAVRDTNVATVVSSNLGTVTAPDLVDGDTLVYIACVRASVTNSVAPNGFTYQASASGTSSGSTAANVRIDTWTKKVANAAAEAGSNPTYAAQYSGNIFGQVFCMSIPGLSETDVVNVAALLADTDLNTTVSSPTATTDVDGCEVIFVAAMNTDGGVSAWAPTDATELAEGVSASGSSRVGAVVGYEHKATAGAITAEAWTATVGVSAGRALGLTLALSPPFVTADAGPDQLTVPPGTLVELDYSGSVGADTYTTTQLSGTPDVTAYMVGADTINPTFFAPAGPWTAVFQVEVENSGTSATDTDTVTISVPTPALIGLRVGVLDADGMF